MLLDLHLPDLGGHDVLRTLKRRADTKDIPVVILSADASPGLARKLVEAGAEQFLTKPLDFDVVLALLDDVARRRAAGAWTSTRRVPMSDRQPGAPASGPACWSSRTSRR